MVQYIISPIVFSVILIIIISPSAFLKGKNQYKYMAIEIRKPIALITSSTIKIINHSLKFSLLLTFDKSIVFKYNVIPSKK